MIVAHCDGTIVAIQGGKRRARRTAVRKIVELRQRGLGFKRVAVELTRLGYPTPRGAATWSHQTVARIAKREQLKAATAARQPQNVRRPDALDRVGAAGEARPVLASVMPGVRELRAPLAAGYLWLLWAWLVWGTNLPDQDDVSGPLGRIYDLQPIVSAFGVAVVASVAAFIVGSIAIEIGDAALDWLVPLVNWVQSLEHVRLDRLLRDPAGNRRLPGGSALEATVREVAQEADETSPARWEIPAVVERTLSSERDVLKTRLLQASADLHSEVDRPDNEALFRSALWPPLAAISIYMGVVVSPVWFIALLLPALLIWQQRRQRREADDALATAIACDEALQTFFKQQVVSTLRRQSG